MSLLIAFDSNFVHERYMYVLMLVTMVDVGDLIIESVDSKSRDDPDVTLQKQKYLENGTAPELLTFTIVFNE